MTTIHIAWDDRAIDDAFASLGLGTLGQSKTTKTYCGKRVVSHNAQKFSEADCGDCIERYTSERDDLYGAFADVVVCTGTLVHIHKLVGQLVAWFCHGCNCYHPPSVPETVNHQAGEASC